MHDNIRLVISFAITCFGGLSTALFALPAGAGPNSWTAIGPDANNPYGTPFAVDPSSPSTIYSVVNGLNSTTIMKTTDGGGHWTALPTSPASFKSLVIDPASPTTIYAVGGTAMGPGTSIYKSIDGGVSWARESNGVIASSTGSSIDSLVIAPSRSSTLYATQSGVGVLKSIDGGSSWTNIGNGLPGAYALAVDPTNADAVYVAVADPPGSKIFKLTPDMDQWRQLPISFPAGAIVSSLAIDPVTPFMVYATYYVDAPNDSLAEAGMFKSIDGGETWMAVQNPPPYANLPWAVNALAIDPSAPRRIYAAGPGMFMSTDAAASWVPINSGLPSAAVWGIYIDPTGSILRTASYAGLFEYLVTPAAPEVQTAVEYGLTTVWEYGGYFSYFVTSSPAEIAAMDAGGLDGCCGYFWQRTGESFDVWTGPTGGALPTCRFLYATFSIDHNIATLNLDHFYTPYAAECAAVQAHLDWHWQFEGIAFYLQVPDESGHCPHGTVNLYRLYNNGMFGAPAHRMTTSEATLNEMLARSWAFEGDSRTFAFACVPSSVAPGTP
jgi:photosystem II stability/assembly factor-like uncharacterized protein